MKRALPRHFVFKLRSLARPAKAGLSLQTVRLAIRRQYFRRASLRLWYRTLSAPQRNGIHLNCIMFITKKRPTEVGQSFLGGRMSSHKNDVLIPKSRNRANSLLSQNFIVLKSLSLNQVRRPLLAIRDSLAVFRSCLYLNGHLRQHQPLSVTLKSPAMGCWVGCQFTFSRGSILANLKNWSLSVSIAICWSALCVIRFFVE